MNTEDLNQRISQATFKLNEHNYWSSEAVNSALNIISGAAPEVTEKVLAAIPGMTDVLKARRQIGPLKPEEVDKYLEALEIVVAGGPVPK